MWIAWSMCVPPSPSSRRIRCARLVRRSGRRLKSPISYACSSPRSANPPALIVIKKPAPFSLTRVADDLLTRWPDARAMVLFPIATPSPKEEPAFVQSLLTRGFTRMKAADDVLDLHEVKPPSLHKFPSLFIVLDRLVIREDNRTRLVEAIETAFREGEGRCSIDIIDHGRQSYSTRFLCQSCGRTFEPLKPILFSFNHPLGACPECKGFGNVLRYDPELVIPDEAKSLAQGAVEPWSKPSSAWWQKQMLLAMKRRGVDVEAPFKSLPKDTQRLLWEGDKSFDGINDFFEYLEGKRYKLHVRVFLSRYRTPFDCPSCHGSRLKPDALFVKIAGHDIHQTTEQTVESLAGWVDNLPLRQFEQEIATDILRQLRAKLAFLRRVGLGYLTLNRQTKTLSGGEAQRVALANQLGSRLVGTLYVLDEPTIGLHARDTDLLAGILHDLANAGNTVVVVEHDRRMIESADYIVELGPQSGEKGGEIVCAAPMPEFIAGSSGDHSPVLARRGPNSLAHQATIR